MQKNSNDVPKAIGFLSNEIQFFYGKVLVSFFEIFSMFLSYELNKSSILH